MYKACIEKKLIISPWFLALSSQQIRGSRFLLFAIRLGSSFQVQVNRYSVTGYWSPVTRHRSPVTCIKRGKYMKGILYIIIAIFVTTILIPMFLIYSCDTTVPNIERQEAGDKITKIRIYRDNLKRIEEMELEEYVKGVVSSEMPASFDIEALKAQAIAARTKVLYQKIKYGKKGNPAHPGAEVCDTVHCQVFRTKDQLKEVKPKNWMRDYWPKIEEAVESTRGLVITYEGKLIDPLYHSTSGGRTENSEDVFSTAMPYLRSVESPYEQGSSHLEDEVVISTDEFISKINTKYKDSNLTEANIVDSLEILARNEGGSISKMKVGNKIVSGRNIRELFGLKSANFEIVVSGDKMIFKTKGYGHGVGMSQYGADGMAKHGYKFGEILKHYYQGVEVKQFTSLP